MFITCYPLLEDVPRKATAPESDPEGLGAGGDDLDLALTVEDGDAHAETDVPEYHETGTETLLMVEHIVSFSAEQTWPRAVTRIGLVTGESVLVDGSLELWKQVLARHQPDFADVMQRLARAVERAPAGTFV